MEANTGNHHYRTTHKFRWGLGGIITGVICGLLGVSSWYLMTILIFVSFFKAYFDYIKMDQPLDNQSLYKFKVETEPWVLHIEATLMTRFVRWILLALMRFRVKSFCKISAEYISITSIAFSVFWASRDGSFQMKTAVSIWLICIGLLRGRLVSTYSILRSFFITIVAEAGLTLDEYLGLLNSFRRIQDSLIQKTFSYAFIRGRVCWRSSFYWFGVTRSAVSQEYKHLPLGKDRNIRLFQLYSWIPFLGVRGTLRDFALDSTPSYEAISYHWGTVSAKRKLYVDGIPLTVSKATYDALHARSSLWRTRLVWIDYICIDQSNLPEKAGQIPLMKDIYHQASRVIVYLGRPSNVSDGILVHFLLRYMNGLNEISNISVTERFKKSAFNYTMLLLVKFLNNPWFARVWVI